MSVSPLARQFIVAGSTHLAALSVGGVVGYPGVLLQQLQANNTIVQLDLHNGSWIGSVHGLAGIPSILMPLLMQSRGRRFSFLLSLALIVAGWIVSYLAESIKILIIAECFHGLGGNSLLIVSTLSISEIVQPEYRNSCIAIYGICQAIGMLVVGVFGRFINWKPIALIMSIPMILAIPIGCIWTDSPSWLAFKGKFEECERAFERLRGTDEESRKELKSMINFYKKEASEVKVDDMSLKRLIETITRRDFYMPTLHMFVLINQVYWGGGLVVIIYASDMVLKSTQSLNPQAKLYIDCMYFIGFTASAILARYYSSKNLILLCMPSAAILMSSAAVVTYLQSIGIMAKDSEIAVHILQVYVLFINAGTSTTAFAVASELMPVKHRGIGGSLFIIFVCLSHASSMKAYPYLSLYITISGIFSVYAFYLFLSFVFIWKYIPNTKNKSLHEIEQYYNDGYFKDKIQNDDVTAPFVSNKEN